MRNVRALWVYLFRILGACVLLLGGTCLLAQTSTTGAILGTVADPQQRSVPGAEVKVTNQLTNDVHVEKTDEHGGFVVPLLPVGRYKVEVTMAGFAVWIRSDIQVNVTEQVTVNVNLSIGTVAEAVHITATPDLVDRSTATLGGVVGSSTIEGLPLATRNFTQLMVLSPGVSTSVPNAGALGLNSIELSSGGARGSDNSVEINGADATNVFTNTLGSYVGTQGIAVPAADSLEEFKVQTAMYSATTGRNGGANIAVVTKSGTNDVHGDAYEYFRNDAMDANDFFSNAASLPRPVLRQNQFGATAGGPIRKDKIFFFGSYQGTRQTNAVSPTSQSVAFLPPIPEDRSAASLGAAFAGETAYSALVPGGFGPPVAADGSNINPVALAILNAKLPNGQYVIPSPTLANGESKFTYPATFREDQFNANFDFQFSDRHRLSWKYFYSNQQTFLPFNQDGTSPNQLPGWGRPAPGRNDNLTLTDTYTFTSNLVNVARFGYVRIAGNTSGSDPITASQVGMSVPSLVTFPLIEFLGQFSAGNTYNETQGVATDNFSFADSVTLVRGRHSLQFGGELKHIRTLAFDNVEQHAVLLFVDFPSFLLGLNALQNNAPYSDVAGTATFGGTYQRDYRINDYAAFIQDDYRASRRLTLNLGLRYDFFGWFIDAAGRNSNFDFSKAIAVPPPMGTNSGYIVGADTPGTIPPDVVRAGSNRLVNNQYLNFEPRIGFAYQPFEKTSNLIVRGGYGIYFSREAAIPSFQGVTSLPFASYSVQTLVPFSTATLQDPFQPVLPPSAFPLFIPRTPSSDQMVTAVDPSAAVPYVQQFSLGIQYEFAPSYVLEIGFLRTKGTHLSGAVNVNQPLLASVTDPVHGITTNTVENALERVPFQGLSPTSSEIMSAFDSSYNALQVGVTKHVSRGFQFTGAYTFAKALDNLSEATSGVFLASGSLSGNQDNYPQARGLSDFDLRNRLVFSYLWKLPQAHSAPPWVRAILNGWETTGLLTLQSGLPLTITDSLAATIYAQNTSRAQFAPGMTPATAARSGSVNGRLNEYFNTNAFTTAPSIGDGTGFGNSGRGILRGPDQRDFDMAFLRIFPLSASHENLSLQFRVEAFNLTNTPSFGPPGTDRAVPASFGVISTTTTNPRILQLGLKLFF